MPKHFRKDRHRLWYISALRDFMFFVQSPYWSVRFLIMTFAVWGMMIWSGMSDGWKDALGLLGVIIVAQAAALVIVYLIWSVSRLVSETPNDRRR